MVARHLGLSGAGPYGAAVDWWAVGALAYEMLVGEPPFQAASERGLFKRILAGRVALPSYLTADCHSFLRALLEKDPARRLGCRPNTTFEVGGFAGLRKHPWFAGLDWIALERGTHPPPLPVALQAPDNTSRFDGTFTSDPVSADFFRGRGGETVSGHADG
jgi:Serine/threonine protein kinase